MAIIKRIKNNTEGKKEREISRSCYHDEKKKGFHM